VRQLEDWLGLALFRRHACGVSLTEAGAALWPRLDDLLDGLEAAIRATRASRPRASLVLSTLPSMAARWLLPRLGALQALLDPVELKLVTGTDDLPVGDGGADLVLRYCLSAPSSGVADLLAIGEVFPVLHPRLLARGPTVRAPADLARYPLIQHVPITQGRLSEATWDDWFRAGGGGMVAYERGPQINYTHLCLQAATDGVGVALTSMALAADLLAAGNLVRPLATTIRQPGGYYLVVPPATADQPAVANLRRWFKDEMNAHLALGAAAPIGGAAAG
jgi:LysR family glycine cleavage system transcriptional activator